MFLDAGAGGVPTRPFDECVIRTDWFADRMCKRGGFTFLPFVRQTLTHFSGYSNVPLFKSLRLCLTITIE
jgi:hypothetical protein